MQTSVPFLQVLLLDEITVDLDVLARADLLEFLKEESEQRGTSIIYVCIDQSRKCSFRQTLTLLTSPMAPH